MGVIKTFRDLDVYQLAYELAMDIFHVTKEFPKDEKYSLIDQIRRAPRPVAVNIAEGWGKRRYENSFKRHLTDAIGSVEETKSWLLFSLGCKYLSQENHERLFRKYEELGAKLFKLHDNWKTYL